MIHIEYKPWALRGCKLQVWQIYVDITDSHGISGLLEVKNIINNNSVKGIVLIENRSKAMKRLGWDELSDGVYYRRFE